MKQPVQMDLRAMAPLPSLKDEFHARATRPLEDLVRRRRGQVTSHAPGGEGEAR